MTTPFVSTGWLADHLAAPGTAIVDARWFLPGAGRDAKAEYGEGHIPGAVFFDIDTIADHGTALPHMLPSPEHFAEAVGALGIAETATIVVYDEPGLFSAPRVWWSFRTMGVGDVRILAGGLKRWRDEGRPLETRAPTPDPVHFTPNFAPDAVADLASVRLALDDDETQVVDARPAGRFTGREGEPRAGLRAGHMPRAMNVPVGTLVENGELKDADALRDIFAQAGVDLERPLVTTCGSGVTAAVLGLALETAGARGFRLYDGSWAEWGAADGTPVETGTGSP